MTTRILAPATAALMVLFPIVALADQQNLQVGGDSYAAGDIVTVAQPVAHDAFVAGRDVTLAAPVGATAHLAGFNVVSSSDVGGSVYAAGFSVSIGGSVRGDVTAIGNTVSLNMTSPLPGNARTVGQVVRVDTEVDGALVVIAQSATLNQPVKGDVSFYGENITFGPAARVDGQVLVHAPKPVAVPESVAAHDRVIFTEMTSPQAPTDVAENAATTFAKRTGIALWGAAVWWLFLIVIGALFIAFGPRLVGRYEALSATRPWRRLGVGVLGLATLLGLVPVVALTIVGLLLVPIVFLAALIGWSLAYLTGTYLVGYQIGSRLTRISSLAGRIGVLVVSLVVAGLLAMIPFVGWLISLLLVLFGFGTVVALILTRWSDADRAVLSGASTAAQAA